MAHLLVVKGFQPGQRLPLPADKVFLGRDPTCGVILPDNTVSRKHALISRVQGKYFLEDGDGQGHKSRNGILLNNQPVPFPGRVLLKDQDRITINDFEWSFHEGPGPQQKLPDTVRFKGSEPGEERTPPPAVEASISLRGSSLLLQAQPAEKLQVLLEISNSLSKTLELEPLLPRILDSLFQLFKQADRGFLILHDEANHQLVPKVVRTRRPQEEGNARFSRSIVQQCLDKVQALLSTDATTDERFGQKNESILGALIRSVMCAPLWSQDGKAFGVIQLDTQDPRKKFTEEDLKLLMGVASQASIALANARLYQDSLARERLNRELELAREVQRSFLPLHLPKVPGYEFFARYESAEEVGGDYYDFLSLPGSRLGVLLGDVAGKGVPAALVMVKFSAEARTCLLTEPELAAAITRLNTNLSRTGLAERFVTLAALVLDPAAHTVTLVNAGHPPPLLFRQATGQLEEATPHHIVGWPICALEDSTYESCQVALEPGDRLVLFSDGVTEAMDVAGNQLGIKGVEAAFQRGNGPPSELGARILQEVKKHAAGRSQHDDITLVCLGRMI